MSRSERSADDIAAAATVSLDEVPIIDFAPFLGGDAAARRAVAGEIANACEQIGFFYLTGHGVPQAEIDAIFAAAADFFFAAAAHGFSCAAAAAAAVVVPERGRQQVPQKDPGEGSGPFPGVGGKSPGLYVRARACMNTCVCVHACVRAFVTVFWRARRRLGNAPKRMALVFSFFLRGRECSPAG